MERDARSAFIRRRASSGRIERRRGGLQTRGRGRVEAFRRRAIAAGFSRTFPCDGRERLLVDRCRSKEFRIRFSSQTSDRRCSPYTSGGASALRLLSCLNIPLVTKDNLWIQIYSFHL